MLSSKEADWNLEYLTTSKGSPPIVTHLCPPSGQTGIHI